MKRCKCCGLPASFPGISFNTKHLCNYCVYHDLTGPREALIRKELGSKFLQLISSTLKQRNKHDCIVAYSGGKDSTFLLHYLKTQLGFKKILAHTFDNGYTSKTALQNIRTVTKKLEIESRITRPNKSLMNSIFSFASTERIPFPYEIHAMMSQVCAACIGMVLGTTLKIAMKNKIPLVFIGFTPGQYPIVSLENFQKMDSCIFLSSKIYRDDPLDIFKILADPFREKFGASINPFFLRSQYVDINEYIPKVLFPYHAMLNYDEKHILKIISSIGWVKPTDTDSCSTNCLINCLGNVVHKKMYNYHPYVGELAHLVREGKVERKTVIETDTSVESQKTSNTIRKQLGAKNNI